MKDVQGKRSWQEGDAEMDPSAEALPSDRDMSWVSGLLWGQEAWSSNPGREWLEEETHVNVRISRAMKGWSD